MVAGSALYSGSAFRNLGVLASASTSELFGVQKRWLEANDGECTALELGCLDLPWLDDVPRQQWLVQARALDNPELRLRARLFWFHIHDVLDSQAIDCIKAGHCDEACKLWQRAFNADSGNFYAVHNCAVIFHSRALANPRGAKQMREDVMECLRCWHSLTGNIIALKCLMLDGETEDSIGEFARELSTKVGYEINSLLCNFIMASVGDMGGLRDARWFFNGEVKLEYWAANCRSNEVMVRKHDYYAEIQRAEECAYNLDADGIDIAITNAERYSNEGDEKDLLALSHSLHLKLLLHKLRPVQRQPILVHRAGLGVDFINTSRVDAASRSYEGDLVFRMCYLPVWHLGRFRAAEDNHGHLVFLGRRKVNIKCYLYNIVTVVVVLFLLFLATPTDFKYLAGHNKFCVEGFNNGQVSISREEFGRVRRDRAYLLAKLKACRESLNKLEATRRYQNDEVLVSYRHNLELVSYSGGDTEKLQEAIDSCREAIHKLDGHIAATKSVIEYLEILEKK